MEPRNRPLDLALLAISLIGPLFHILGMLLRGVSILNAEMARLGLVYGVLALSAAGSAYLALRPASWLRLAASLALLANLGSVAYAGMTWSAEMKELLAETSLEAVDAAKIGVLVCPLDHTARAVTDAREMRDSIEALVERMHMGPYVEVRRMYPVGSTGQARHVGERFGANIVLWQREPALGGRGVEHHITVLGANETAIELEPLSLLLLMGTRGTLTMREWEADPQSDGAQSSREAVERATAAFAALAVGQPVFAAIQFEQAAQVAGVSAATARALHDVRGIALLLADRPDLAIQEYEGWLDDVRSWVGMGNVYISRREWQAAKEAFQMALTRDSYDAIAYCGLGVVSAVEHDVSKAISAYRQAIALEPDWSVPYALLGLAYELEGNARAAREAYLKCAERSGPNRGLYVAVTERAEAVLRNPPTPVPTATPRPVPSPTPVPARAIYTVQRGDVLQAIADSFEISMQAIVDANNLDDPNAIFIGQQLIIPRKLWEE